MIPIEMDKKPIRQPLKQYKNSLKNTMTGAKTSLTLQVHNKTKPAKGDLVLLDQEKKRKDEESKFGTRVKKHLKKNWKYYTGATLAAAVVGARYKRSRNRSGENSNIYQPGYIGSGGRLIKNIGKIIL